MGVYMKKLTSLGLAAMFVLAALVTACSSSGRSVASEKRSMESLKHSNQEWQSYFGETPDERESHGTYDK